MTNLSVTSPIRALNQPVNDIIASLLASKHKATTRNTYRQNLKYFAHYLLQGLSVKGKRIIISDTEIKRVLAEFLAFEKLTGVAYLS
jgi:hypothetical protein